MAINLKGSNFLTLKDFTPEEIQYMIDLSDAGGACIGGKFDPISCGLKY